MRRCYLCHYHEVALKKDNRAYFERKLRENILRALSAQPVKGVRRMSGRLLVELEEETDAAAVAEALGRVFGLVYFAPAWESSQDLERLKADLWSLVRERSFQTFKIHARRSHKRYPFTSQQLNERLGAFLQEKCGKGVRLDDPDLTCHVDLVEDRAFLYFEKIPGPGGLPSGTAGKVAVLLSGGIDSPVAAYKIMRRGCRPVFVHFHSYPHTTLDSQEKVRELVRLLSGYLERARLYMVPFAEAQREIVAFTPPHTRVILYRRLMVRVAERIARRERALALVTGDSIGQVASQTLENLAVVSRATQMPILRPLVGEDKEQIVAFARSISTYPISIQPEVDCCTLFVPRHPETRARIREIEAVEARLEMGRLIRETVCRAQREEFAGTT